MRARRIVRQFITVALACMAASCDGGTEPTPSPTLSLSPSALSFQGVQGGANPPAQSVAVGNTGGGTLSWTASASAPWVTVAPAAGTAPSALTVGVNTTGLAVGTHSAVVSFSASGATNSPAPLTVTLTLTAPPAIGVSPASFAFTGQAGGASPASQTLSVTNTGGGTLSWTATDNASWLTLSPASGTAPGTVTLAINTAGLSAGTYSGTVTITGAGASNSPVTVPVTLTLGPPPAIGVSPASFAFTGQVGGASPASQTLSLTNTGGGTLSWSASDDAAWLTLSSASGTAPSTVTLAVNTAGLSAGTYSGTVTITGAGASNSPVTVGVSLTVTQPYNGTWSGKTAQDSTLTFQVVNGRITTVTFGYYITGPGCVHRSRVTATFGTPVTVSAGAFTVSSSGGGLSYTFAGNLGDGISGSGTLQVTYSLSIPGLPSCNGSVSTTWTATRVGGMAVGPAATWAFTAQPSTVAPGSVMAFPVREREQASVARVEATLKELRRGR